MADAIINTGYGITAGGSAARPGQKPGGGDQDLFLRNFAGDVLTAYEQVNKFEATMFTKTIGSGRSDVFPVIGRKLDAFEHGIGQLVVGGDISSNEVEITTDRPLVDAIFLDEIEEIMTYYEIRAPYAQKLAESISLVFDRRAAITSIQAARTTAPIAPNTTYAGLVIPNDDLLTDVGTIVDSIFQAWEYKNDFDISGEESDVFLRSKQYSLLSRSERLEPKIHTGGSNISSGTTGSLAGMNIILAPHLPKKKYVAPGAGGGAGGALLAYESADELNPKYRLDCSQTVGLIKSRHAAALLNRRGIRTTMTYKEDRLGWLMMISRACGFGVLRPECSIELATSTIKVVGSGTQNANLP